MQMRSHSRPALKAEAVVHLVDPVNRELAVTIHGAPRRIYVPPDCGVVLWGQRVKFRKVQPGDRVQVVFSVMADPLVAEALEVQPAYPPCSS